MQGSSAVCVAVASEMATNGVEVGAGVKVRVAVGGMGVAVGMAACVCATEVIARGRAVF